MDQSSKMTILGAVLITVGLLCLASHPSGFLKGINYALYCYVAMAVGVVFLLIGSPSLRAALGELI